MLGRDSSRPQRKPCIVESVAAWKSDVKSFFSEDWTRLRALIMELEEEGWSEDTGENGVRAENSAAPQESDQPRIQTGNTQVVEGVDKEDRLQELAAQIEQRLQAASEGRD